MTKHIREVIILMISMASAFSVFGRGEVDDNKVGR